MPAFKLNGYLVNYAAFKDHLSLFPGSSGVRKFKKYLRKYKWLKGTVQFSLTKPLQLGLVRKIVRFRLKENLAKRKLAKKD
jgi:uncharacterized protein YdhG (YjbR/CyaY superfamily)